MWDLWSFSFFQRAFVSSILIGAVCSITGVFVILNGLSFMGAGIAHAAFAGVALGFLLGLNPLFLSIIWAIGAVWIIGFTHKKGELKLDASISIMFSFSMALAILFIGFIKSYNTELFNFLFGNLFSITNNDLWIILIMSVFSIGSILLFFKEFFFISFDPLMAEASGIPSDALFFFLLNIIGLTVVISLKSVGSILVFGLLVTPAASAYQLTHNIRIMMGLSLLFGVGSSILGLFTSYYLNVPSGSTIVIILGIIFFISMLVSPKRRRLKTIKTGKK